MANKSNDIAWGVVKGFILFNVIIIVVYLLFVVGVLGFSKLKRGNNSTSSNDQNFKRLVDEPRFNNNINNSSRSSENNREMAAQNRKK